MLSKFIEDLKTSKYLENIVKNHKIIMLFVSGSRILDVVDERSDYDLIAVVDENVEAPTQEFLTYNNLKVHWYYIPLASFINAYGVYSLQSCGAVQFANITDDVIIYSNPTYEAVCKLLIANKNFIAANGVNRVCAKYADLIKAVVETGEVLPEHHTKILAHLCVTSLAAVGEKLTDKIRDYVRQLKRIRWQPVSDEAKRWCVLRLTILKNLIDAGEVEVAHSIC